MTITEEIIEAGARAMWCAARGLPEADWTGSPSHILDDFTRDYWRDKARACLTAAHAAAEQEGVIFTRIPAEVDISGGGHGDGYRLRTKMGWNNCRAAVLAGRVVV
jgi:hypothetical protein